MSGARIIALVVSETTQASIVICLVTAVTLVGILHSRIGVAKSQAVTDVVRQIADQKEAFKRMAQNEDGLINQIADQKEVLMKMMEGIGAKLAED